MTGTARTVETLRSDEPRLVVETFDAMGLVKSESYPVPPLPASIVKGRATRWRDGRWQIETAKGWY